MGDRRGNADWIIQYNWRTEVGEESLSDELRAYAQEAKLQPTQPHWQAEVRTGALSG